MRVWRRLTFSIPESSTEDLIVCLYERGTLGVEPGHGCLTAWFTEPVDAEALTISLRESLGGAGDDLRLRGSEKVPDGLWHERWLEGLTPIPVGRSFLIVPGPAEPGDTPGRRVIRLTPGRAFGTGEHDTTRMCLELLERTCVPGEGLLDLGTGSGILSIAGRLLGAEPVVALDIDPEAVSVAARNASLNGVSGILLAAGGPHALRPELRFARVVANLNGVTLARLMREIASHASAGMILSGILAEEEREVTARATLEGFGVEERLAGGDWVTLGLSRGERSAP